MRSNFFLSCNLWLQQKSENSLLFSKHLASKLISESSKKFPWKTAVFLWHGKVQEVQASFSNMLAECKNFKIDIVCECIIRVYFTQAQRCTHIASNLQKIYIKKICTKAKKRTHIQPRRGGEKNADSW